MTADQTGRSIVIDDELCVVGRVRRIEDDVCVLVLADGRSARVPAGDTVRAQDLITRDGSRQFTAAPSSAVAAVGSTQLVRQGEVDALFTALTLSFLGYLAGKQDAGRYPLVIDEQHGNPIATVASTTLTQLWAATIPANTLPGRTVRATLLGDLLQNSGAAQNLEVAVLLGGTQIHRSQFSVAADADRYGFRFRIDLAPRATGQQMVVASLETGQAFASGVGLGNISSKQYDGVGWNTSVAKDETTALALSLQVRWVTSTSSSDVRVHSAITEAA